MAALPVVLAGLCFAFVITECSAESNLLMVNILFRHGDRSPIGTFPTNPLPESAWPQGYGQLSTKGMVQHFELGKYFRKRYIEGEPYRLLNSTYRREEVKVRSTDYDRTLMSAYSNLAGLFPPSGDQLWNQNIPWQPIPVHTIPQNVDYLLNTDVNCPKYDEYYQAELKSDEIKREEEENKDFYQLVANKTGTGNENISTTWDIYDPIFCASCHGLQEPDWINLTWRNQTVFSKLREINSLQFDIQFNRLGESRLRGGPLLGEVIKNMEAKIKDATKYKYKTLLYSAHDSTVSAFLSAMKVFNRVAPPYTATVIVELHEADSKHFVQILYKNDSSKDAYPLQMPGCSMDCPFEDFVRLTKENIPVDWHAECRVGELSFRTDGLVLMLVGIILLAILIVTIAIFAIMRGGQRHRRGYIAYDGLTQKDDGTF